MSRVCEIFQEGTLKVLGEKQKLSASCSYAISSDGKLNIYGLSPNHPVHSIDILLCSYSQYDAPISMEGYFIIICTNANNIIVRLETPLDFKSFGFACFKLSRNEKLAVLYTYLHEFSSN
jgi:hypothetical protein